MKSIKLNQLNSQELEGKTANRLYGGVKDCCCSCNFQGQPGGSSVAANDAANDARGLSSPNCHGGNVVKPKPEDDRPGTQVRP